MRRTWTAVVTTALAVAMTAGSTGTASADARAIDDSCPASTPPARFFDVRDDSAHVAAVDCLVHWKIAQGTDEDRYSPARGVTRAQMAAFLARLVTRSGGTLPSSPPDAFDDDDGNTHEASINALAAYGVVTGRGDRRYEPLALVTRDQMAAFLVRAYDRRTGTALPAGPNAFDDDTGNTHEAAIDRAAAAGFAAGTATRTYSPTRTVRRDHMAAFLARVLDKLVQDGVSTRPAIRPLPAGCDENDLHAALCAMVDGVQSGDLSRLRSYEREVAATMGGFPKDPWVIDTCELVGDVTVTCEIRFTTAARQGTAQNAAGFYLGPVNGDYDFDGGITVPPGEQVRYAVGEYRGLGRSGAFRE